MSIIPELTRKNEHSRDFRECSLKVAGRGIEPRTSWLWIMRSNQLSYPAVTGRRPDSCCWDRRTRTLTDRARICSATITPYLNLPARIRLGLQIYNSFLELQYFFGIIFKFITSIRKSYRTYLALFAKWPGFPASHIRKLPCIDLVDFPDAHIRIASRISAG